MVCDCLHDTALAYRSTGATPDRSQLWLGFFMPLYRVLLPIPVPTSNPLPFQPYRASGTQGQENQMSTDYSQLAEEGRKQNRDLLMAALDRLNVARVIIEYSGSGVHPADTCHT